MPESVEQSKPQDTNEVENGSLDFESHYGVSCHSVRDMLMEILEDMSSHRSVHNWDKKLIITPLRLLATAVRGYVNASGYDLNTMLAYSAVDEILTVGGVNHRYPAMQNARGIDGHLFFTKVRDDIFDARQI